VAGSIRNQGGSSIFTRLVSIKRGGGGGWLNVVRFARIYDFPGFYSHVRDYSSYLYTTRVVVIRVRVVIKSG
jgi:hypothetical protein